MTVMVMEILLMVMDRIMGVSKDITTMTTVIMDKLPPALNHTGALKKVTAND